MAHETQPSVTDILNPSTPMSDQDWISPYYFKPTSSRQLIRINKNINEKLSVDPIKKFSKITAKELYSRQWGELLLRT